jgi:ABC-type polysaccharide/polyol phosphate transport system ATPase subunit
MTPAIELTGASLAFHLTRDRAGTLKEFAIQTVKRKVKKERLWAVRDVTFKVAPGEVLGVIGPNGAGKSTLMKMVARVLPPTEGRVVVRGLVAPMIELGAGFNPEMTAYENIILYGTLLGRTPGQMQERVASICDWADLNDFIDVPTRSYSSGMLARLGFSVATDTLPEVLVVDEVLSVGDAAFQEKSKHRMIEMIDKGAAVLFVSHDLGTVRELSDRVIWLDHGTVQAIGSADDVVSAYQATFGGKREEELP